MFVKDSTITIAKLTWEKLFKQSRNGRCDCVLHPIEIVPAGSVLMNSKFYVKILHSPFEIESMESLGTCDQDHQNHQKISSQSRDKQRKDNHFQPTNNLFRSLSSL